MSEIVVTFVEQETWTHKRKRIVDGAMILVHPNGCIEVLSVSLDALDVCATAELDAFYAGKDITHNACEIACAAS